jgi:ribonucleoside-diphosphate reductase alpha chain
MTSYNMAAGLTVNALKVLEERYLLRDLNGKVIETPEKMFKRVAKAVAKADLIYDKKADVKLTENIFFEVMRDLDFLPNTPTLMNAGTSLNQLSACFVILVEDNIKSIFDGATKMALIHKTGGGTGFDFSKLRPEGDVVKSTKGVASGPVSFMKVYDTATEVVKQGGKRRGANMGILRYDHPDILKFIDAKKTAGVLENFNVSVAANDLFMKFVLKNKKYWLINPRNKAKTKTVNAKYVFDKIVKNAWETGDPGLVFIDEINRKNPTAFLGEIVSTNPCGEQPLHAYESCNLGSINLARCVSNGQVDWKKLRWLVHVGVHFLDNVIDVNNFPLLQIKKVTKANRRIGLGMMGFAEMLLQLKISYASERAVLFASKLMKFVNKEAKYMSQILAKRRGSFPNFKKSSLSKKYKRFRNATVTTVAPTGTISIIAGCSSGIEPLFGIAYVRNILGGKKLIEVNKYFERIAKLEGFYSKKLIQRILKQGNLKGLAVPGKWKKIFITASEIKPEYHVKMQAAFQKYTDNAVSKTINFPKNAKIEDVKKAYLLAWKLKCKGITVYRYGSKKEQVLYLGTKLERKRGKLEAGAEYSGGCPGARCHN